MNKVKEIREMSDEQIRLVWKDSAESLFRLRMEAQTEKLASPSEVQKNRRTIARCQTILVQRMKAAGQVGPLLALGVVASAAGQQSHAEATSKSGKRIKKQRLTGRASVRATKKAGARAMPLTIRKRSQSSGK